MNQVQMGLGSMFVEKVQTVRKHVFSALLLRLGRQDVHQISQRKFKETYLDRLKI
jgi:hypothetical protein